MRPFYREPDFLIGGSEHPYMRRWWVIPRNKYFNIYLHNFLRSDDDRALHDHPWNNMSILLKGQYLEHVPKDPKKWVEEGDREELIHLRKAPFFYTRKATSIHRVELIEEECPYCDLTQCTAPEHTKRGKLKPVWTLFITGPWVRSWGFWCPKGFRPWREFVDDRDSGRVGKGCAD